jgi:hypothetical protein
VSVYRRIKDAIDVVGQAQSDVVYVTLSYLVVLEPGARALII